MFDIDSAHSHACGDGVAILVKKSEIPQPGVVCFDQPGDLGLLGEWCTRQRWSKKIETKNLVFLNSEKLTKAMVCQSNDPVGIGDQRRVFVPDDIFEAVNRAQ